MAGKTTKDMTNGSPIRLILGFAVPLLFGMLFQQFYSMVDTIIVGKHLGVDALAGVGSTGSINFMVLGFCNGVCSGFAIPVAQSFGAGDYRGMRRYVTNSVWLAGGFALLMTVVVCILCRPILHWMNTPEDIFELAYDYIFVIFLGIPAMVLYNLLAGIIRSLGDSKTPVLFLILAACLNIGLDIFMIDVLKMGVGGAAWATVLSQLISGLCCLVFMVKNFEILHPKKDEWKLDGRIVQKLCNMGIPMGLQYSITAIGSVVLQTSVNTLGSASVAAMTAAGRINGLTCCPFDALGSTMATYSGQNLGAKKLDRVKKGLFQAAVLGSVYAVAACIVLSLFGRQIALLFVESEESAILDSAQLCMRIVSSFYSLLCLVNTVRFSIQGLGYSRLAVLAGICEMFGRAGVAFLLVPPFGFAGACFAGPAAWVLADAFLVPAFFHCVKELQAQFDRNADAG